MPYIPNNDLGWEEWTSIGLAIYAASDGQGFDLFDAFSQKSKKYDYEETRQRWDEITGSPPNRTGIGKLRKIARANGWVPKLYVAEPTYPADDIFTTADMARSKTQQVISNFLNYIVACPKQPGQCVDRLLLRHPKRLADPWFIPRAGGARSPPVSARPGR